MPVEGLEQHAKTSQKQEVGGAGGAKSGAPDAKKPPVDPDLRRVIDGWPALPKPIRDAILAMIGATMEK